ncbi:UDP-glucose:glycoprotein glucosyltransferase 1-like isoform X2 [Mercenaria mercenaria]|uniref:UDP-glucose:glycoprotein glucosyltransferase 1-like isoform X2 n=1 Tax=Mercenaria mercenaria TaxID=6596 RepID=UPI00234EC741|nr:UDP-glucose:glycoprotein glucosyltransferase 1-like isoform X2 [Mercenaria mercenaria]
MKSIFSLVVIVVVGHVTMVTDAKPKYVSVNLEAKWSSTPMLLEASEFLASEGNDNFWGFVGRIAELNPELVAQETDKAMYHLVQKFSSRYLSPMLQNFLKMYLSLRAYSPMVEMFQQMAIDAGPPDGCDAFVYIHGEKSCDLEKISGLVDGAASRSGPALFKFDHVYPSGKDSPVTVILYAQLGTAGFKKFHNKLVEMSSAGKISYIYRHYIQEPSETKTRLSGYGVELAIKSTEYKAKDDTKVEGGDSQADEDEDPDTDTEGFLFSTLREKHPELKDDLRKLKTYLSDSSTELAAFKVWQLQDLGLQAAQKIMSADPNDALQVLKEISQNFPSVARALVKVTVDDKMKKEIEKNQQYFENYHGISGGDSALYVNGIPMDMDVYDVFTLLDVMKSEAKIMEGLFSLGFKGEDLYKLLQIETNDDKQEFALDIRHSAVQYINDLETDEKYKGWPDQMQDILRPTYPGMLRHVAKNFFNLVFIVDPLDKDSRELLKMAEAFYVHSVPVRMGIVFAVNSAKEVSGFDDPAVALAYAFDYIRQEEDAPKALTFITDVYETAKTDDITVDMITAEFKSQFPDEELEKVFGKQSEYDYVKKSSGDFLVRSGLSDYPQVLLNGKPLKKSDLNQDNFEEGVISEIMQATPELQQNVYQGRLHDGHNVLEWLMEKDNVLPRLNSRVLSGPSKTLDLSENIENELTDDYGTFEMLTSKDMSAVIANSMKYFYRNDESNIYPVSMWLVSDLQTEAGRSLAYSALKRIKHSNDLRLGFLSNTASPSEGKVDINKAVHVAANTLSNTLGKNFITKLVKEENFQALQSGAKTLKDLEVNGMDMKGYLEAYEKQTGDFLKVHRLFAERVLEFGPSQRGLVTNGQVLGPLGESEEFINEDVDLLELFVKQKSAKKIKTTLKGMKYAGQKGSDLLMKVGGLLTSVETSRTRKKVNYGGDQHSVVKIPGNPDTPAFQIEAIVDPASSAAQKLAPILMVLKDLYNLDIRIYMNSREKLSEMPQKRYYRYVLNSELTFKADGSLTSGPIAKFTDLPHKSILTLAMEPPESWLVQAVTAQYDLDNILLEEVKGGVTADFDLESLLLEGHCYDANTGQPPRGLQFVLGTNSSDIVQDTIVMANLGYFQLKATPGAWTLNLRKGRSSELFDISSHEYTDTPAGSKDVIVTINDFKSKTIRVKVGKKPGMEKEKLLDDSKEENGGLWNTISSSFSGGDKSVEDSDQTLNIFSVASGHLYERLLRIMMMGVLKHTKSKVKFWFLKNYLSPSFKDFIPHYAKEYGFEYEFVEYKWPRWLNQQKEKQRIIWGYKILFLDVLFPLHVKKFIFVDADQIVRSDLQELNDLDLGGAPYGYTPFCSDRTEMDGFRFWKSGYWASHLAGRKYHISALYVVDLKRFRQIAAGDRLRGQYQGLSQDPNSLSNLDQDLPNNMIHQVAIKSLPQEWLWCETWCSDESKKYAKTIDLCNNPMTKEPKLKAAMRIAPEWKTYDYEIKVFWDSIYGTNTRSQIEYDPPELSPEKKEAWRDRIEL